MYDEEEYEELDKLNDIEIERTSKHKKAKKKVMVTKEKAEKKKKAVRHIVQEQKQQRHEETRIIRAAETSSYMLQGREIQTEGHQCTVCNLRFDIGNEYRKEVHGSHICDFCFVKFPYVYGERTIHIESCPSIRPAELTDDKEWTKLQKAREMRGMRCKCRPELSEKQYVDMKDREREDHALRCGSTTPGAIRYVSTPLDYHLKGGQPYRWWKK